VLGIVNGEIGKLTDESVQKEIDTVTFTISLLTIPNTSVLISISFCTLSSVNFSIFFIFYICTYLYHFVIFVNSKPMLYGCAFMKLKTQDIETDYIGRCKSNYHTIVAKTTLNNFY
jgi:hypothetical protein